MPQGRSRRELMHCYEIFVPATDCIAVCLSNEQLAQLGPDAIEHATFAICRTLLDTVMHPVPIYQRRHPKINFASHIEVTIFIPNGHLLTFDFARQFVRAVYSQALVSSSFPPADFKHSFYFFVN